MNEVLIELIGGPKDGERMKLSRDVTRLFFPRVTKNIPHDIDFTSPTTKGIYLYVNDGDGRFIYVGQER